MPSWWMPMPAIMPRTVEAATSEARRLADRGRREAMALFSSGNHNADGTLAATFRDLPWNHGAVWSMNSMPGIAGETNDFKTKWNLQVRQRLYGLQRKGDLDGEYIDSSEGYVTDELDFHRDHFAAAETPLVFSLDTHRPAIFRGLIAFEYIRAIATDMHATGKLMMANATPDRLCWLTPMLDVLGTETDWNPRGKWQPMDDAHLLYRRALCKGKPFCFLMNTAFENFSHDLVERYMKRSLAYGCFPGFFSYNASEGHYFTRPELYERDRDLFRTYVPLCKVVAKAGWETITGARSGDEHVHIERFGDQSTRYLTIFNDSPERRDTTITLSPKTFSDQPRAGLRKERLLDRRQDDGLAGSRGRGRSRATAVTHYPTCSRAGEFRRLPSSRPTTPDFHRDISPRPRNYGGLRVVDLPGERVLRCAGIAAGKLETSSLNSTMIRCIP